ncbi:hypothetical protein BS78_01G304900 [Paspalum vaginatum]|nr:hypothetical protein BS78_01G304900 [Paspalum vaginatum]
MAAATTTTTTTTTSSALAVVLLLCLCAVASLANVTASAADLVAKACADATSDKANVDRFRGPGLTRESCESALRSDKLSAVAKHPRDLALVAMDLLLSAAAAADAKVDGALRRAAAKWGKVTTLTFRYCRVDYQALARTVPVCRARVQEYNTSGAAAGCRQEDVHVLAPYYYFECVDKLRDAAGDCWKQVYDAEDGIIVKTGAKEAVWKEVVEATRLANLAKAMTEQMVGMFGD